MEGALPLFLNLISENALLSSLVAAAVLAVAAKFGMLIRDARAREKIYRFLLESSRTTAHRFRTTEAISSATKMPEARVEDLCNQHPRIRRNSAQRQSWTLVD